MMRMVNGCVDRLTRVWHDDSVHPFIASGLIIIFYDM